MTEIIFILGGAKSGKSQYAIRLAKEKYIKVAFIAPGLALDKEMKKRIKLHKKRRPAHWQTFEQPKDIPLLLKKMGSKFEVIIIDCLTLWVSGFLLKGIKEDVIINKVNKLLSILQKIKAKSILVSNEVGLGIVPKNRLGRDFRDIAGRVNQIVAEKSDSVFFMFSGIPLKIK